MVLHGRRDASGFPQDWLQGGPWRRQTARHPHDPVVDAIGAPAIATLIGLLGFLGRRLDRETHDRVRAALAERDSLAETALAS